MGLNPKVQSRLEMDKVEISSEQEFGKLKDLQRKFSRMMAETESELAVIHSNVCEKRLGKCRVCLFKEKIIILDDEFEKMVLTLE